jgi:hypothetical protein
MVQVLLLAHLFLAQTEPAAQAEPAAVISLYNSTPWAGPLLAEVPTGTNDSQIGCLQDQRQ